MTVSSATQTNHSQNSIPVPQTDGVIDRPRLHADLERALQSKLTLVCAPPGYGKTTIVAQHARRTTLPVIWLTIEARDRDVPYLHQRIVGELLSIAPGIDVLPISGSTPPDEQAAHVMDYLRSHVTSEFMLVMDDAHHLTGSPLAERWLRAFVTTAAPNCRLVIVSRTLPDLPYTSMIARREVTAIGQDALKFEEDEVQALTKQANTDWDSVAVERLHKQLEGWPAGTVLALFPLPSDLEKAIMDGNRGPEALFSTLANLMLQAQPPGLRDFLLVSSVPEVFTPEICARVLDITNSPYWLGQAQKHNLFLTSVAGGLEYHRLFRRVLQEELYREDSGRFLRMHGRIADWYEQNNRLEEAFEHYFIARQIDKAAAIAHRVSRSYFTMGRVETLLDWRETLNSAGVLEPELLIACAKIFTDRSNYTEAEEELRLAETMLRKADDDEHLLEVHLQRAMINLQRGEYQAAIDEVAPLVDNPATPPNQLARVLRSQGMALLRMGRSEDAVINLERSVELHRTHADSYALSHALQDLALGYSQLGRLADASASLQEVVATRREMGNANSLALAFNNLGYYYHRGGNYDQAMITLRNGLSVSAKAPNRRTESYLFTSMADLQRDLGAYDEAENLYAKALELIGEAEPNLYCAILNGLATLWRWRNDVDEARLLASRAYRVADDHVLAIERALAGATLAIGGRHNESSKHSTLRALLEEVAFLEQQDAQFPLLTVRTMSIITALNEGKMPIAEQQMALTMEAVERLGTAQPMAVEVVNTASVDLFTEHFGARYSKLYDSIADLRKSHAIQPPTTEPIDPGALETMTYSLRVRAFHWESIECDGKLVEVSRWRSAAARELFFYLLFNGAASRQQISLAFWPDSAANQTRSNFHTTLHRARKALGENVITYDGTLYHINPDVDLWCDSLEMESLTHEARLLSPRDARTEDLWLRAVALYQGEFLPSIDGEWAAALREYHQTNYLDALLGLGTCIQARSDFRQALAIYRRALQVDPYREDIHRTMMICYAESGDRRKVLSQLEELEAILQKDLGIPPSQETQNLARMLLK